MKLMHPMILQHNSIIVASPRRLYVVGAEKF